jgi:hypothetical protein
MAPRISNACGVDLWDIVGIDDAADAVLASESMQAIRKALWMAVVYYYDNHGIDEQTAEAALRDGYNLPESVVAWVLDGGA